MEAWKTKDLVSAGLYEDEKAVVQDAMRAPLSERAQLGPELAIHRYRAEEISLAKAAALAGVSWERMREILMARGVALRIGPEAEAEALDEIQSIGKITLEHSGQHYGTLQLCRRLSVGSAEGTAWAPLHS